MGTKYNPESYRRWYARNRMLKLARVRGYNQTHRLKKIEYLRQYRLENAEKQRQASLLYRRTHSEDIVKKSREYYLANRDMILRKKKAYAQRRPECAQATRINRRTREKVRGRLTISVIQFVYEQNIKQYGTLTCYLCGGPILFGQDSLEHKTPIARGGGNEKDNLAIAHRICNTRKNNKTETEYREYLRVLANG